MIERPPFSPSRLHIARLRKIWQSAGWPIRDGIEIDLLAANCISLSVSPSGHETLRLTDVGLTLLAAMRNQGRRGASAHDRLAQRMGEYLATAGRIVWREVSFRAQISNDTGSTGDEREHSWRLARPDLFSVRNTSVEHYLEPTVHEIKTSRADLLSDLRHFAKRESYQWLCCECFYVFPAGIAEIEDIPEQLGVWLVHGAVEDGSFELARPARRANCRLPFHVWLALAKATPMRRQSDPRQADLTSVAEDRSRGGDAPALSHTVYAETKTTE